MRIQHLIPNLDLAASDRMTSEFLRAQATIKDAVDSNPTVEVEVMYVSPNVDCHPVPEWAREIKVARSAKDVFFGHKIYPLILARDLINLVNLEYDLTVVTNSDICLRSEFYEFLKDQFLLGTTSMSINRRTIEDISGEMAPLEFGRSAVGRSHPGADCFVFLPAHSRLFEFNDLALGLLAVDEMFLLNMSLQDSTFVKIKELPLTFHFGDPRTWQVDERVSSARQNFHFARRAMSILCREFGTHAVSKAAQRAGLFHQTLLESFFPIVRPGLAAESYERNIPLFRRWKGIKDLNLLNLPPIRSPQRLSYLLGLAMAFNLSFIRPITRPIEKTIRQVIMRKR